MKASLQIPDAIPISRSPRRQHPRLERLPDRAMPACSLPARPARRPSRRRKADVRRKKTRMPTPIQRIQTPRKSESKDNVQEGKVRVRFASKSTNEKSEHKTATKPSTTSTDSKSKAAVDQARTGKIREGRKGSPGHADAEGLAARNGRASRSVRREQARHARSLSVGWKRRPRTKRSLASSSTSKARRSAAAKSTNCAARSAVSARPARKFTPCSTRPSRRTISSLAPAMKS